MGRADDRRQLVGVCDGLGLETGPRPPALQKSSADGLGQLGHGRQLDPIDPMADELAADGPGRWPPTAPADGPELAADGPSSQLGAQLAAARPPAGSSAK